MFQGLGKVWAKTTQLGDLTNAQQRAFTLGPISWSDNVDSSQKESQTFIAGELKTKRTVKGSSSYTLDLAFNEVNWGGLGFAKNEFPKTGTDVPLPSVLSVTVPTTAPYEITNAFFTGQNDTDYGIYAIVTDAGSWGQPGGLIRSAGVPNPGEVQLDTANTKLVFNSAQAGAKLDIPIFATAATIEYYGGPGTATQYGVFELWGEIYVPSISQGIIRHYPELEIASEPSVTIDNNVPTITVTCSAGIPTGWEKPYAEYNKSTAT